MIHSQGGNGEKGEGYSGVETQGLLEDFSGLKLSVPGFFGGTYLDFSGDLFGYTKQYKDWCSDLLFCQLFCGCFNMN